MSDLEIVSAFKKIAANGTVTPYRVLNSYMDNHWEVVNPMAIHPRGREQVLGRISISGSHYAAFPLAENSNIGFCDSLEAAVRWIMSCYPIPVEM